MLNIEIDPGSRLERETGSMPPLQLCSSMTFTVAMEPGGSCLRSLEAPSRSRIASIAVGPSAMTSSCFVRRTEDRRHRTACGECGCCVEPWRRPATFGETRLHDAGEHELVQRVRRGYRAEGRVLQRRHEALRRGRLFRYDVQQSVFGVFLRR